MDSPRPIPVSRSPAGEGETAPEPAAELAPGTLIADRYRVVERLGEGGMGVVYRVEHTHMRKLFALKVLHSALLQMPEAVSRFEREAVLAGSINHPNVAAATDFGKLPDGSFFLILELVVGKGLRELIADGPLEVTRALPIMRGMTAGVAAAHGKGIVHRDLKPDNVMLVERDGSPDFVKVLDFGIAKGDAMPEIKGGGSQPLTQIGAIMGTPAYMSPEQALGQTVDDRSDLYSLGVMFFELITGALPFQGDGLQVLRHHLMTEAPPIPAELVAAMPVPIASIVARLLEKEPEARFQSATELLGALDGMSPRAPSVAETVPGAGEDTPRPAIPSRRSGAAREESPVSRRLLLGVGAFGVMILVAIVLGILSARDPIAGADTHGAAAASASAASAPATTFGAAPAPSFAGAPALPASDEGPAQPLGSAWEDPTEPNDEASSATSSGGSASPSGSGRANHGKRAPAARPSQRPRRSGGGLGQKLKDLFR